MGRRNDQTKGGIEMTDEFEDLFKDFEEEAPEKGAPEEKIEEKPEKEVPKDKKDKETEPEKEPPKEKPKKKEPKEEKPKKIPPKKEEFDYSDAEPLEKTVITIWGKKGKGKTSLAFGAGGKIVCFSYDKKASNIKENMGKRAKDVIVKDAVKYLDKTTPDLWMETGETTFRYVIGLLDNLDERPDWIVHDGSEILHITLEMAMRHRNNLKAFQGIHNRNIWKERRMMLDQIQDKSIRLAKKGIIYTAYTDKDKIIEDGEVIKEELFPKWIAAILEETDVTIHVDSKQKKESKEFIAIIDDSKRENLPTGKVVDVTNKGFEALYEKEK